MRIDWVAMAIALVQYATKFASDTIAMLVLNEAVILEIGTILIPHLEEATN